VPGLAWISGRCMGRRDWRIGAVLLVSVPVVVVPHLVRLAVLVAMDGRDIETAGASYLSRAFEAPEVGLFFLALGVFVTMLGWTSTPVVTKA
jgi:hypothetical protein